ncbi:hypothetical protein LINPERPRIM_LOCUS3395, partial [Linum perenne]
NKKLQFIISFLRSTVRRRRKRVKNLQISSTVSFFRDPSQSRITILKSC